MLLFLIPFSLAASPIYCDVSQSSVLLESNSKLICNSTQKTVSSGASIYIVGKTTTNYVKSQSSYATFTLLNTNINSKSAFSVVGGKVKIVTPKGYSSTLTSSKDAGISCSGNAEIEITGESTGKLTAISSSYAGIGGGKSTSTCKAININGKMEIDAQGGYYGAGIGAGQGFSKSTSNIDRLTITNGKIKATSISCAGIGAGVGHSEYSSNVGELTILGGEITAVGGNYGAGIGGGYGYQPHSANVITLNIYGGSITATGGEDGAGIGAGSGLSTNNASSVKTFNLNSQYQLTGSDGQKYTLCLTAQGTGGLRAQGIGSGINGKATPNAVGGSVSCSNLKCTFGSSSSTCADLYQCDVVHCLKCPTATSCTACQEGYKLVNGKCEGGEAPTEEPTKPTQKPTAPPTPPPTKEPTPLPIVGSLNSILYCPNEHESKCSGSQSWATLREEFVNSLTTSMEMDPNQEPYQYAIQRLQQITETPSYVSGQKALSQAFSRIKAEQKASENTLVIFQYGDVVGEDVTDFSYLNEEGVDQSFVVDYISLTNGKIKIKGGKFESVLNQLTCVLSRELTFTSNNGEDYISIPTIKLLNSYILYCEDYNVSADYLIVDRSSGPYVSTLAKKSVRNLVVSIPDSIQAIIIEMKEHSIYISVPYQVYTSNFKVSKDNNEISTDVASEQTSVACTANTVTLQLDPTAKEIDYQANITLQNQNGNVNVDFDGENWKDATFEKPLVIDAPKDVNLRVNNKPSNLNVEVHQPKQKKKLSGGAIAGIVIAVLVVVGIVVFLLVYCLVCKKKKARHDDTTNTEYDEALLKEEQ